MWAQVTDWAMHPHGCFGPVRLGNLATDQSVSPLRVSGVGPRPVIGVHTHLGTLGLSAQAAGLLIWVHTDPWLWACAPGQLGY